MNGTRDDTTCVLHNIQANMVVIAKNYLDIIIKFETKKKNLNIKKQANPVTHSLSLTAP